MKCKKWKEEELGNICLIKGGKRLPKGSTLITIPNKHPYIRVKDMTSNKYISLNSSFEYVDKETQKKISRYIVNKGDVIISIVGTTGLVSIIDKSLDGANLTENCVKLIDFEFVFNDFVYYFLTSQYGQGEIKKGIVGSTQPKLPIYNIAKIKMPIPPLFEQKKISNILSSIDNKIEVNDQINKKLEEIAQTIFKHWFIDFEFPYLPDGAGKPYEEKELNKVCKYKEVGGLPGPEEGKCFVYVLICENDSFYIGITDDLYRSWYEHKTGIGAKWTKANKPIKVIHYETYKTKEEAAKREKELQTGFGRKWLKREYGFPAPKLKLRQAGEMFESKVGLIPKKWLITEIENICSVKDGTHASPKSVEEGYPLITSRHLMGTRLDFDNAKYISKVDFDDVNKRSKVNRYDILISMIGTVGNLYLVQNEYINFAIKNIGLFKSSEKGNMYEYLYCYLKTNFIKQYIKDRMAGSTQQYISLGELRRIPVILPSEGLILEYKKIAKPIFDKIYINSLEKKRLEGIRDTLLPKLMSGEIRVPFNN